MGSMGDCNTWTCAQVDRLLKPYTAVYLRSGVRRCVARGRVCTFPCRTCYYFMESELSGTYGVASWVALFLILSLHSPHLSLPTPSAKKAPRHRRPGHLWSMKTAGEDGLVSIHISLLIAPPTNQSECFKNQYGFRFQYSVAWLLRRRWPAATQAAAVAARVRRRRGRGPEHSLLTILLTDLGAVATPPSEQH